ncbi:MAG: DUF3883 domain-containing protein [Chloroflexota bacterium]
MDEWEQIIGNPAIEKAAIAYVIECERRHGRTARDARGSGLGGVGDVESDGRIIEVKADGGWWRTGRLYFTPPQLREGEQNPNYYVYIVENVAQGDPSKFELRVLHGEDLQRLFAGAKVHRLYVPVRAADYARLTRLCTESEPLRAEGGDTPMPISPPKERRVVGGRKAHPIRDIETDKEYRSKYQAGKDLYWLVGGDVTDLHVWFKIARKFPDRFQTKSAHGDWVGLNDPSAPIGTTRPDS